MTYSPLPFNWCAPLRGDTRSEWAGSASESFGRTVTVSSRAFAHPELQPKISAKKRSWWHPVLLLCSLRGAGDGLPCSTLLSLSSGEGAYDRAAPKCSTSRRSAGSGGSTRDFSLPEYAEGESPSTTPSPNLPSKVLIFPSMLALGKLFPFYFPRCASLHTASDIFGVPAPPNVVVI